MTENRVAYGELRRLSLRSECQAAVSTPVKATDTRRARIMSARGRLWAARIAVIREQLQAQRQTYA